MPRGHHSRLWRIGRIYFRRFRILVWLLLLAMLGSLVYLNQVGLPQFVKRPLLEKLRARGLVLQFSRLRLRFHEGIVAENVRFGSTDDPLVPRVSAAEVQLLLNWNALAHRRLQVDALALRQGRLLWPLSETNPPAKELAVEGIRAHLLFVPGDQWILDDFHAHFAGATIRLSGAVTNASAVGDWSLPGTRQHTPADAWQKRLRRLAEALENIQFAAAPDLRLELRGDARDLQSFSVLLLLEAPRAQTPWGAVTRGRFTARVFPADTNGLWRSELKLDAADSQTRWGAITNVQLQIRLATAEIRTNVVEGDLRLSAGEVSSPWAHGSNAVFTAHWLHSLTNPVPLAGQGRLECALANSPWASVRELDLSGSLSTPLERERAACDASWGFWTNLQPYRLDWQCQARTLQNSNLTAGRAVCTGTWRGPELTVSNLQVALYGGHLAGDLGLNVATRQLTARLESDFDPHRVSGLLNDGGPLWLKNLSWEKDPKVAGEVSLILPAWTNRQPDWKAEVLSTLALRGEFEVDGPGAYRQVRVDSARSHFSYSNLCWDLPDLVLTAGQGRLEAIHHADDRTKDLYWRISSTVDLLRSLRPLLDEEQQRGLALLSYGQPPALEAEIWGRSYEPERTGFRGRVALTNFVFRGQTGDWLTTVVQYTNRVLQFLDPKIQRGTQHISAEGVMADFNAQRVYLTNGFSTAEPLVIARAIGDKIGRAIEPYQFLRPPLAFVHGTIPMHGEQGADLHFLLDGGPFQWWKFTLPQVAGHLHWKDLRLNLNEIRAAFYGGEAQGAARFDFVENEPTRFSFQLTATNAMLRALMADLGHTNQVEGRLSGNVVVAQAETEHWESLQGYGHLALRDGLIWDIPLFGIFSPILNGIAPGLGNSRATAGACSFAITNGVLSSDDLEIRTATMRLRYRGSVDWESRMNARVDAELLRDMWVVGPLVSTMFWPVSKMFEYKLQGTLAEPKAEPVFILPKIMLLPFHPLRTLKGFLPEDSGASTNAPPSIRRK